ncbi:MAG TPA: Hpt domain-containing protein [Spirochaetota bacterium]|nr:Hpt domain-containing protein [Spirochaetota bacterium]HOR44894.1 Hpt domain-containing protein [Spirochaetota bacterium]HPK56449.1 Hpt domain-containing protein [Spirochaetota bacterium]HQE58833.1 Hpt domain-containing protein [Spirochaetota bacterium]
MSDYTEKPVLDTKSVLDRIGGDELRLKQLYSFSIHEIRTWNDKISESLKSLNYDEIRKTVHGIKGSSATIGAERCRSLFAEAEILILNNQKKEALELLKKSYGEIENLIKEISGNYC